MKSMFLAFAITNFSYVAAVSDVGKSSELEFLCSSVLHNKSPEIFEELKILRDKSKTEIFNHLNFKCENSKFGFFYQFFINKKRFSNSIKNLTASSCEVDKMKIEKINPVAAFLIADYCGGQVFDSLPVVDTKKRLSKYISTNHVEDVDLIIDSRTNLRALMFSYIDKSETTSNFSCFLNTQFIKLCGSNPNVQRRKSALLGFLNYKILLVEESR